MLIFLYHIDMNNEPTVFTFFFKSQRTMNIPYLLYHIAMNNEPTVFTLLYCNEQVFTLSYHNEQ